MSLNQRQQKLAIAIIKQSETKPISYYSNLLSVSERTIYSDLDYVSDYLSILGYVIERDHKGVHVTHPSVSSNDGIEFNIDKFFRLLEESDIRVISIVEDILFKKKTVTYKDLSEKHFISQASILTDINLIKTKVLSEEKMLVSDSKGTRIIGNETEVHESLVKFNEYCLSKVPAMILNEDFTQVFYSHFYGEELYLAVNKTLYDFVLDNIEVVDELYINNVMNALISLIYQIKYIAELNEKEEFSDINECDGNNVSLARFLLESLSKTQKFSYTKSHVDYLETILEGNKMNFVESSSNDEYVRKLIVSFSNLAGIDLSDDNQLFESLKGHFDHMIYRLQNRITHSNPFVSKLYRNYFLTFNILWFSVRDIEQQFNVTITPDEIGFLVIYFQLSLEKKETMKQVVLVCPMGISASQILSYEVQKLLPPIKLLKVTSLQKLHEIDMETVDFIISTVKVNVPGKETILVSPLLAEEDKRNILDFNKNFQIKNNLNRFEEINPFDNKIMLNYLRNEEIYLDTNFSKKEEILSFLLDHVERKEYVSNEYRNSVMNREKSGPTDLRTGLAIPHGDSTFVNQSGISILTNRRKVKWHDEDVQVVILVYIAAKDIKEVKGLFREIYEIANSNEKVKDLLSFSKIQHVMAYLGGETND